MKKNILCLMLLFCIELAYAQQVGDGYSQTVNSFNSILNTGVYDSEKAQINYPYEIPQWPWKYLFVMRHSNPGLNYQFQVSTTFEHDDRVFFRKLAHLTTDTNYNNDWKEFATRGSNTFNGDQRINGNQSIIGNQYLKQHLFIPANKTLIFGDNFNQDRSLRISYIGDDQRGDSYIAYSEHLFFTNGTKNNGVPTIVFTQSGSVGIGTIDPQVKLDVNGTIRAKEIKVESNGADFVFDEDYNLPTLEEVAAHIKSKKHLPDIPSASEVSKEGMNLGEMSVKLLQKIEELTLYTIKLQEEVNELKDIIKQQNTK